MDEETLANLEMKDEALQKQVSIEEKKALINEAKRRYGRDWSTILNSFVKKGSSGGSGMDWQALKFKIGQ